jgi:hypothetical protein
MFFRGANSIEVSWFFRKIFSWFMFMVFSKKIFVADSNEIAVSYFMG